jgi:hypothetical protein
VRRSTLSRLNSVGGVLAPSSCSEARSESMPSKPGTEMGRSPEPFLCEMKDLLACLLEASAARRLFLTTD